MNGRQRGFTYVALLIGIAIIGAGLAAVGQVWHTTLKRERERELLFIGNQFRQAIKHYRAANGSYPATLEALLLDDRAPVPRHHLRKMYVDPMTGAAEWGVVKTNNAIVGVYSLSEDEPLKKTGFAARDADFENKSKYSEWTFLQTVGNVPLPAKPAAAATPPATAP